MAGAPLAGAHALITLSDLHLPWATIEAHLRGAATAGWPWPSTTRGPPAGPTTSTGPAPSWPSVLAPSTAVVVVTDATGPDESVVRTTLSALDPTIVGMRSIVLVGRPMTARAGICRICPSHAPAATGRHRAPHHPGTVRITDACTACGACLATCPERALRRAPRKPVVVDDRCTACWDCVGICPAGAIVEVGR